MLLWVLNMDEAAGATEAPPAPTQARALNQRRRTLYLPCLAVLAALAALAPIGRLT